KEMSPEIEEALADARKWLDKMKETDKKYMTKILDKFPEGLSNKTPFKKFDYNALLPQPPQDNPKIPGASGAIELKYSDKFGRHVVATRDINAGEIIMVHTSYATVIDSKYSHKNCWYCCKRAWSGIPCHKCVEVIYCNETCRDKAWSEHHEIECKVMSVITRENVDLYDLLALRLTVKAYKEAGSLKKLQEKIQKIDAIDDPILKCFTNNRFDYTKYESVYSLWRHNTIDFETALRLSLILHSLAATSNIFGEKILNFKQLLNNEEATFIGTLILVNLEIVLMNAAKLSGDNNAGFALDPLWSLFNHSCDPETINFTSGNMMSLTAFQRLEKGQQRIHEQNRGLQKLRKTFAMNILDQVLSRSDDWKEHFICFTSSQISYVKTDEEKVKIALRYLTSAETKLNIQKQIKSTTKAREYIKEGEQKLETSSWPDSVEIFTKVVMHAEIDSNELAQAYANRSAALYIGGLYENALTDIERALKIGYSDNEKTKLYVRRVKCLFALKNTMSPEIEEALADAHKWLGKMNDADKEKMKDILNEFPKNSSTIEVPYHKYDYNQLLPKPPQDNPKIPGVSDAVELKYSKEFGRHVVATKNIKAGETIMVRRAYATVINSRFRHKYCWYCCKQLWA
ncbi:hypothetical protein PV326_013066, partial [Microctonus aethiopoides]